MALKWPSIPDPGVTTESLLEPVRALKAAVEMILGLRAGAPGRVPVVYRDYMKPGITPSPIPKTQLVDGDLFIDLSNNRKLNYWDGALGAWIPTT